MSITFLLNPLLELELETSDENLIRLFEIRFANLYSSREQDIGGRLKVRIQQVPEIHLSSPRAVQNLGLPDDLCLFNEQNFVIVKDGRRLSIPFLKIGRALELLIIFEEGFPVDWLRQYVDGLIAYHLLGSGASLYHAACLGRDDCEIIIPAWRGTGKTSLALYLMDNGASAYKAEDQFLLTETGESYAYTDASHVDFSHMEQFPGIKRADPSLIFAVRSAIARLILPFVPPKGRVLTFLRRGLLRVLAPKVYVKLGACFPDLWISDHQPVQRILLQLISQPDLTEPVIRTIDLSTVIGRTLAGMQYERENFYAMYHTFVYATGKRNCLIDNNVEVETQILQKALEGASCYEVRLPSGNGIENFDHILEFLQGCI